MERIGLFPIIVGVSGPQKSATEFLNWSSGTEVGNRRHIPRLPSLEYVLRSSQTLILHLSHHYSHARCHMLMLAKCVVAEICPLSAAEKVRSQTNPTPICWTSAQRRKKHSVKRRWIRRNACKNRIVMFLDEHSILYQTHSLDGHQIKQLKDIESAIEHCARSVLKKGPIKIAELISIQTTRPWTFYQLKGLRVYSICSVPQPEGPDNRQGPEGWSFESLVIGELCKLAGVPKSRITPYHPLGTVQMSIATKPVKMLEYSEKMAKETEEPFTRTSCSPLAYFHPFLAFLVQKIPEQPKLSQLQQPQVPMLKPCPETPDPAQNTQILKWNFIPILFSYLTIYQFPSPGLADSETQINSRRDS
ncbi:hypothetical protein CHS0354_005648 [Potamilus streckersoni]|uniref:Uncharacterized protein n=1 Tax=Potamilus streckersoni TaxID=2493646 RepID=A0AAE0VN63_9BIVA|nr:hypothetical protein CHS0354_005648 [Potamilus streckersoni]